MRRDKNTFILSTEYESFTDDMTDEEAGKLFKAILRHENGGEVGEVPAEIRLAWSFIRKRLDNNKAAYEAACESHREARTNGNKTEQNEQKVTKGTKGNKTNKAEQKPIDNENDNDNENENDNDNEKDSIEKPKRTQASLVGESNLSDPVKDKLIEWLAYKKERREGYKETGLKSLITEVGRHEQESGSTAVINLINECMANGWRGIIWDKLKPTARSGTSHNELDVWANA